MKKYISTALAATMALSCLTACSNNAASNSSEQSSGNNAQPDKLQIVTTIFPEYDWVKQILGDNAANAEITMLLDNGIDLHSYQPTAEDIMKISECDMFIYVGGESDEWVEDALKEATNKDKVVINLVDSLGDAVKEEEIVEGMEHDHDHEHEDEHEHEEHEDEHEHEHEEIAEEDIKDRTLSEFAGEWQSLYPLLKDGALDEYCEHKAEEDGDDTTSKDTYLEKLMTSWACEVDGISIDGDKITFTYNDGTTCTAEYAYAGYSPVKDEEGDITVVRYQFKTDDTGAPTYVQFNDHGHEPGEVEHFHIYFGNESFDSLMNSATNPYFMPAAFSAEGVLEGLMGHNHEHEDEHEHEEHEDEHEHEDDHEHEEEHHHENDEHVWLSLRNAKALCGTIQDALCKIDPANSDMYKQNADSYTAKLTDLDAQYQDAVNAASVKTILFGDRFPFRYMTDDYGLEYYAAFAGCSAETEASFETITFLSGKVDELKLNCVLTLEKSDQKIASTVIQNTKSKNQQILTLDSMQSTTSKDVASGATYLSIMESNLGVLKEALK